MTTPGQISREEASIDLLFFPSYSNPYQELFYGAPTPTFGARPLGGNDLGALEDLPIHDCEKIRCIHLHWLNSVLRIGDSAEQACEAAFRFISRIDDAKRQGAIIAWTIHNLLSHDTPHRELEADMSRKLAQRADIVLVHGNAALDQARDLFPAIGGKEILIPHGNYIGVYDNSVSRAQARQYLGIGLEKTVFLCLGHVRPFKGFAEFLAAFGDAGDARDRCHVIVAGRPSGVSAEQLESAAAASGVSLTCDLRHIPPAEMQIFLNTADWMALPYRTVLTSGSALLAMSFGVPVMAPSIGILPELLQDGHDALLFEPDSPDALGGIIRRALSMSPKGRARMARAALAKAELQNWQDGRDRLLWRIRSVFEDRPPSSTNPAERSS